MLHVSATDGVFSSAEARAAGLTTKRLQALSRAGDCTALTRGWWAVGQPTDDLHRHRLTVRALTRHFDGRAWASHYSALVAAGLPADGANLRRVHLTRTRDRQSRRQRTFTLHPAPPTPVARPDRLAVAIVQTGAVLGATAALVAADAALHRGLVTVDRLRWAVEVLAQHPDTAPTRAALLHADGRHESPGETRVALVLRQLGIVATPQVVIDHGGVTYRVDFLVDGTSVVVEFDGKVKYDSRDALFAEKRREDRLRSWGFEVVRLTWADLEHPARVERLVRAAVARSR